MDYPADWSKGTRVRLSVVGLKMFPGTQSKTGIVTGLRRDRYLVMVLLDGQKYATSWHRDFLEIDE